jgi:hypothetical protein
MTFWRQFTRGLHGLLHGTEQGTEIDDEVRHYFEEAMDAYRRRGLSEEEARRAARLEFGSQHAAEEQVRSYGWENTVRTFLSDLRFACRQLRRNPGFTTISAITLALGIGASAAIFSAINPVLFKPLPYPHPGRILMIWSTWQGARSEIAFGTWRELSQRSHLLGWNWRQGDAGRRMCLATGFSVYCVRILFTEFVFPKRGVSWSEVFSIAAWLPIIVLLLGIAGGANGRPLGALAVVGATLFVLGSWMNSFAEFTRHVRRQRSENRSHLYTRGLFRYSRHPNSLGDLLSFFGLCMICGAWVTVLIPATMLAGFVFVNIPVLDSHLHDYYGSECDEYTRRTRKLIPFLY